MRARTVGAVVALVVAALLLGGCGFAGMQDLPLPGGPDVGHHSYRVTAEFDDVLSLARDSTVKLDGVTVGRVDAIGRDGWKAVVTLRLRGDVALPEALSTLCGSTLGSLDGIPSLADLLGALQ